MQQLLTEVGRAMDAGLYGLALAGALTVPDICSAIGSDDGKTSRVRYRAWVDEWVAEGGAINGRTLYSFRCAMLHQGSTDTTLHYDGEFDRVLFIEPDPRMTLHDNVINGALNIDLGLFVGSVLNGARRFLEENAGREPFDSHYARTLQRYPHGLSPYIGGVAVWG